MENPDFKIILKKNKDFIYVKHYTSLYPLFYQNGILGISENPKLFGL